MRTPPGVASVIASFSSSLLGVRPFSLDKLQSRYERLGLRDVQCHHAQRAWLIMSTRKPAERACAAGDGIGSGSGTAPNGAPHLHRHAGRFSDLRYMLRGLCPFHRLQTTLGGPHPSSLGRSRSTAWH
jgi:hypothetical protein